MKYKIKSTGIVIMSVVLLLILSSGALVLGTNVLSKSNEPISAVAALEELENSIKYSDSDMEISFQIPPDYPPDDWNILVVGRLEIEDFGGMSVHFFAEENSTHNWTAGNQYIIPMNDKNYTDLLMIASLPDESGNTVQIDVDLLKLVKGSTLARQTFSMQIPAATIQLNIAAH